MFVESIHGLEHDDQSPCLLHRGLHYFQTNPAAMPPATATLHLASQKIEAQHVTGTWLLFFLSANNLVAG